MDAQFPQHVYRLYKSLYGLIQAPRSWFKRFTFHLFHLGFIASYADPSLFILHTSTVILYLLFYVDDIIITRNGPTHITRLVSQLQSTFGLKNLGTLNYFLGIQITPTTYGLQLTQSKYASNLLHRFNMHNANPTKTPCNPSTRLSPYDGIALFDPIEYRSLVRAFQYLTFT